MAYQPKVSKARFRVGDIPADAMIRVGEAYRKSQDGRLARALDIRDASAPPLKRVQRSNFRTVNQERLYRISPDYRRKGYADYKVSKFGGQPIRDWFRTGLTRRSIKVLSARPNQVSIGPTNSTADLRITFNQRRWPQFGVSPNDQRAITAAVAAIRFVRVEQVA